VNHKPLVLVADDDPDILELVSYILGGEGYEIVAARDGAQALDLARARRPQLAVLDVSMPNLDGLEVTRLLRADAELASLPVILLTARVAPSDEEQGLQAGATDYLPKPFKPKELRERVAAALGLNSP
jgi:two-component system, OmpR family, response regulator MtrA